MTLFLGPSSDEMLLFGYTVQVSTIGARNQCGVQFQGALWGLCSRLHPMVFGSEPAAFEALQSFHKDGKIAHTKPNAPQAPALRAFLAAIHARVA